MKVAVIIFTYNRPWHTKQVIDGLKKSIVRPEKLFIFQDGKKADSDDESWNEVNRVINEVSWCDCEVNVSPINIGLAKSVIKGISVVASQYDCFIVLEDDCVPHPLFMTYMINALDEYRQDSRVFCINGFSGFDNIDLEVGDTYFSGRISSWGWGTWSDRWNLFEEDYKLLNRIKKDVDLNAWFNIWGRDLENYLYGNIDGRCDSWAVFWALKVIEKHALCLNPSKSLINNIGTDGSGRHKEQSNVFNNSLRDENDIRPISFPNTMDIRDDVIEEARLFFSYTSDIEKMHYYNDVMIRYSELLQKGIFLHDLLNKKQIDKIYLWGSGKYFDLLKNDLMTNVEILGIIESNPNKKEYNGFQVINYKDVKPDVAIFVIPGYDMKRIKSYFSDKETPFLISFSQVFDNI